MPGRSLQTLLNRQSLQFFTITPHERQRLTGSKDLLSGTAMSGLCLSERLGKSLGSQSGSGYSHISLPDANPLFPEFSPGGLSVSQRLSPGGDGDLSVSEPSRRRRALSPARLTY
jgi:hypothetical protein